MPSRRYLVVSPCRDEGKFIRRTLDSVAAQSIPPALWVVVDDGSTDDTPEILAEYARRLPWLRVVRRTDRGGRSVGPGVIEAFYRGLEGVNLDDYDYVCKLDTDLVMPPRYFELLMTRMEREPRLGTCSGKPWFVHPETGALVPETMGNEMSVGASKFYRVACFREIGGFVRQVMWDGIDCHRARMLGWIAEATDEEELRFLHLRPMGSSHKGIWAGRVRAGFGQYFMGTSPLFYVASAVYRLSTYPPFVGSVAMLWGYLSSWLKGLPRYDDPEFRRFLRSYQRTSLILGKAAATRRITAKGAAVWRAKHVPDVAVRNRMPRAGRVELLDLSLDRETMQSAVDRCMAWCAGPRAPHTVITANASITCLMRRDAELARACRAGDLVLADGMSLVWTLRAARSPLPERVTGVDLMARLLAEAARRSLRVYFLGARREVVSTLAERSVREHPGLVLAGFRDGYFSAAEHTSIVEEIRAAAPHLLFVGMPSPFKETWCERHRARLDVPVIMGVGGSFDVLAGHVRRAPRWMQKAGLEWAWRLLMEPRKLWWRYLSTNTEFVWLAARELLGRRRTERSAGRSPGTSESEDA